MRTWPFMLLLNFIWRIGQYPKPQSFELHRLYLQEEFYLWLSFYKVPGRHEDNERVASETHLKSSVLTPKFRLQPQLGHFNHKIIPLGSFSHLLETIIPPTSSDTLGLDPGVQDKVNTQDCYCYSGAERVESSYAQPQAGGSSQWNMDEAMNSLLGRSHQLLTQGSTNVWTRLHDCR